MKRKTTLIVASLAVTAMVGALLVALRPTGAEAVAVESVVHCPLEGCVAGAVGTSSGRLWLEHDDISADPVSGAVGLQRTYFRGDTGSASFGPGWRSILDTRLDRGAGSPVLSGFPSLPGTPLGLNGDVVTFADGTRWTFDDDGLLVAIMTRAGGEYTIDRDDDRAVILQGEDPLIEVTYSGALVAEVSDRRPNGAGTLAYAYSSGRLVAVSSSDGTEPVDTYRYDYNPGGGLKEAVDAGGETRIRWADDRTVDQITVGGQTTSVQLPSSPDGVTLVTLPGATKPTEYRHDSAGRLIEVRQGDAVPLRREFDTEGRLILERDPVDERRFSWADGRLTRVESDVHGTTELEWDDLGRLVATREPGVDTTYAYEDSAWAPSRVSRGGATTTYTYQEGMLVEVTDPDGVTTEVGELPADGLVSGSAPLTEMIPECGASTDGLVLDAACRPVGLQDTDSRGETTAEATIAYDEYGRIASAGGPGGIEEFSYDDRGRIAATKRGDTTFSNEYSRSRLIRVTTDDGDVFAEFSYDDTGRLDGLRSSQGSVQRVHDSQGRIVRIENGGLAWEVDEFSAAGRPKQIETPYGRVAISYDAAGRVDRTEVSEYGQRASSDNKVTTTYDWETTETGEMATITRGGYASRFAFDEGRLTSARTPLGHWEYSYDEAHPDHLAGVSGPNGETRYVYVTGSDGAPRLEEVRRGDQTRSLEWDEFGRLTKDEGGNENRLFDYRQDGITAGGTSNRKVTWDEAGLPSIVESDGATEIWAWNPDRTLHSITLQGRGLPFPTGDRVWTANYDGDKRLVGFDKSDSDDDLVVQWAARSGGSHAPVSITGAGRDELSLKWTEVGELQRAGIGEHEWAISRDAFRNVTAVSRSGGSGGELTTTWRDGLPVGVSTVRGSMTVEGCTDTDCRAELVVGDRTTRFEFAASSITATSDDRTTEFTRDQRGRITEGCQTLGDRRACTDWLAEGEVGDRRELARFEELLGGTNGQLRGLVTRPLPLDPPALSTLPDELRPEGLEIQLPDEELEAAIAASAPVLPETYRLDADGAEVRLAQRLADLSVPLALGPGHRSSIELFDSAGLSQFSSPFGEGESFAALANALAGIEPDSVLRGVGDAVGKVGDVVGRYGLVALGFAAALLSSGIAGAATLVVAAGVCATGSSACAALAVSGALMLVPAIGSVFGALALGALVQIVTGAAAVASGVSWQEAGIALGASMLFVLVARNAQPIKRVCQKDLKRVYCHDAAKTPETAANAMEARGRVGIRTVDKANADARRAEALRGKPTRPGFDRDESPPAVTRQGGAGARVAYVSPSDNRSAGASLGAKIRDLEDGQRFLYLVTDSRDKPLTKLESVGAGPALLYWGDR